LVGGGGGGRGGVEGGGVLGGGVWWVGFIWGGGWGGGRGVRLQPAALTTISETSEEISHILTHLGASAYESPRGGAKYLERGQRGKGRNRRETGLQRGRRKRGGKIH